MKREDIKAAIAKAISKTQAATSATAAAAAEELATFKRENGELAVQRAALAAAAHADKVKNARSAIVSVLEGAVRRRSIMPADRLAYTKILRVDDDEAVLNVKLKDVEDAVSTSLTQAREIIQIGKSAFSRSGSGTSSTMAEQDADDEFLQEFKRVVFARAKETGKSSFQCMAEVVRSDARLERGFAAYLRGDEGDSA